MTRRLASAVVALVLALSPAASGLVFAAATATPDNYAVAEDEALIVPSEEQPSLLDNDTTDTGTVCVTEFDVTGLQGSLGAGVNEDGSFTYTPPANWNGTTTFTYGVASNIGAGCPDPAEASGIIVTIKVNPVNDAPIAVADSFSALKDRTLNIGAPGVLRNDSDVDGDSLTAVKVSSPAHGVVTLAADGAFSYTPSAGYTGPDAFSYKASDGTATSATRVVSLAVTALPPAPTPTPAPTPAPVPTPSPEPSPSESPLPSDSGLASPSPSPSGLAPPSPTASPSPGPVSGEGGLPIVAIGALALLIGLLVIAGIYFVRSQQGGGDDDGFEPDDFEGDTEGTIDESER